MHFELNEEQRLYRDAIHDFAQKELAPYAAEVDATGQMRWEAIKKMPQLGLTGLQVAEEYGGAALDGISAAIAIEEVGRACGSTGLSLAAHNGLCCFPISKWGSQEQKDRYLPKLTSGEVLGALALTEPNAGSDLAGGIRTSAVLEGDSWMIDGHKAWITNPSVSPVVITLTRTHPENKPSQSLSMLLVETDTDGLQIHASEKKMGVQGSPTHQITYDNVRVPRVEGTLGNESEGFYQTMQTLDGGRIGIGALCIGLAQAAFDEAIKYAAQREAFGKPIAQYQAIQWMLADGAMEIEAARLMIYRAAWLRDQGKDFTKAAAMGKLMASEVAEKVAFNSIQIHGSYGYSREFPVERIYRDQRLMTIGEGTSQIQRMVIARRVLDEYGLKG